MFLCHDLFTRAVTFPTYNTCAQTNVKVGGTFVHPELVVSTETLSTDVARTETFVFPVLFIGIVTFPTDIRVAELMSASFSTYHTNCYCGQFINPQIIKLTLVMLLLSIRIGSQDGTVLQKNANVCYVFRTF